mgnify:CR=1 FL=1
MIRVAIVTGALLVSTAIWAAPESLSKIDTAAGEVLLEVQANGTAAIKITKVSTACNLSASGDSRAEAEKALAQLQIEMRKGFDDAGLRSAALDFSTPANSGNDYDYAMPVAVEAAYAADAAIASADVVPAKDYKPKVRIGKRVGVSVAAVQDLGVARTLMGDLGCYEDYQLMRRPNVETADPAAAKAEAKVKAIAAAKKQANDYAAALGMRLVRIIRISETSAIREFLGPESDVFMQEMRRDMNRNQPLGNEVPVNVSLSVDFALGPK